MARKDILKSLMAGAPAPDPDHAAEIPQPRAQRGAIGAVSRSIADLKSRSVIEIDPYKILSGGLQDRLESDAAEDSDLQRSIAEYGQQVPVLVRPHPEKDGHYQIVYGRRRVLALRDLGLPVKALVRDLDDQELIVAQGQENTARRDLSFIEKVNFARQMVEAGYQRKIICDAISVDKTLMSRMISIAERLPPALIEYIGAAPSVGRDRWSALADQIELSEAEAEEVIAMVTLSGKVATSDDRFQAAFDYLSGVKAKQKAAERGQTTEQRRIYDETGLPLGQVRFDRNFCTLRLRLAQTEGFEDWLLDAIPSLFRDYQANRPKPQDD